MQCVRVCEVCVHCITYSLPQPAHVQVPELDPVQLDTALPRLSACVSGMRAVGV